MAHFGAENVRVERDGAQPPYGKIHCKCAFYHRDKIKRDERVRQSSDRKKGVIPLFRERFPCISRCWCLFLLRICTSLLLLWASSRDHQCRAGCGVLSLRAPRGILTCVSVCLCVCVYVPRCLGTRLGRVHLAYHWFDPGRVL